MKVSQNLVPIFLSILMANQAVVAQIPSPEVKKTRETPTATVSQKLEEIGTETLPIDSSRVTDAVTIDTESTSTEQEKIDEIESTTETNTEPSDGDSATDQTESETAEQEKPEPTPEEIARQQKFAEADRLYLAGNKVAAAKLYREVKQPWDIEGSTDHSEKRPAAINDPAQLNPAAAVYWRTYQQGKEQKLDSKIFVPLQLLVTKYPEFMPAHIHYARTLQEQERIEEAIAVLEKAIALYPNEPELLLAKIETDVADERWLDASITARQFALFNPNHPQTQKFRQLADEHLNSYKSHLRSELTANAISGVITGALGYAVTGSLFGPISAIDTTMMLLRGESGIGNSIAEQAQKQLPMVEDPEILNYVREIGQKIASVAGRDDFEYEFYVIKDDQINAFALPGGKIFIHLGAIMKTNSEAELAGLLAHEISHAVLSHGFQLVAKGNLTANVAQMIPYVGGTAGNLIVLNYSRDMERQADVYGTRILVASGYAADGMRNLMVTLEKQGKEKDQPNPPVWMSTHPNTKERISYLENLIVSNKFNRYAYEGVVKHQKIQEKSEKVWQKYENSEEYRQQQRSREW
ncbi:M48 family metalloprotease [Pleurocapsales cyanobacterium LEGE 06147]|nr:M48 family metalloprotease [Pleurocapsales cyanobacterium LEGE 06147]